MTATDLPAERYDVIDGLRGFALLGIIWINLSGHALPFFAMWDPTIAGGTDAINLGAWTFTEVFVEGAMRGLFSLLFGASTLLFLQLSGSGASRRDLFFKRNLWLIAFGLIHGTLLLMPGDILSTYGLCGLILYFFRNSSARMLVLLAAITLAALCIHQVFAVGASEADDVASIVEHIDGAAREGYAALLPMYAEEYFYFLYSLGYVWHLLDALTVMFAGMALLKSGWLIESRYPAKGMLIGVAVVAAALALRAYATSVTIADNYADDVNLAAEIAAEIGRATLSIGYAILFVGLWRAGGLNAVRTPLAALGRMAFTHYIAGTVIATTLFYGHGFGLYRQFDRVEVYAIAFAVWIAQAAFSMFWLRRYNYGPLEWAWRSLVRWSPQPMRMAS